MLWLPVLAVSLTAAGEPAPRADALDWTVGVWRGTRTDAAERDAAKMRVLVERLPAGAGQILRLEVETEGDPYVGFAVTVPDPEGAGWVMLYANDAREKIARLAAKRVEDKTVWNSLTAAPPRASRLISERLGDDRWRRTQQVSDDDGATWRVLFVDELERSKTVPNEDRKTNQPGR